MTAPALFVERLELSLFRSHARARLETDGRPVALFGPNGAGKTNLLEAVSLLSAGRGMRRAAAEDIARRPEGAGWRVAARLVRPGGAHDIETRVELARGPSRAVRVDGEAAPQARLAELVPVVWLTPAMDRLWTEGATERRRFVDRIALGFHPRHGEAALAYEKAMRERNRLLKEGARDRAWFEALEARMAAAGAATARARAETIARLAAAQARETSAFPAAEIALEGPAEQAFAEALAAGRPLDPVEAAQEAALADALARGRMRDAAAGRTLEGPHRTDLSAVWTAKGVAARDASTGEQKALLISLVLASARALAAEAGAPPLILLDEVSAHLDADRRAALYDAITALGAQAWMTGTGPELFEALGPRAILAEVREGPDGSVIAPR